MDKFVLVLLEASAALLLFYLVYSLWLRKETFFRENRFYLLVTAVISLVLPWINFSYPNGNEQALTFTNLLDVVSVSANGYEASLIQKVTAWQWASIVYFLGFLFSFTLMFIKLVQITRIDKQSTQNYSGEFPENVRFVKANVVPFSFLNKIYINPAKYTPEQMGKIVAHERVHVRQQHTYDCLFYELLVVVFWFHPIVYKYRAAAKEVHEYLADQGALGSGISGEAYQKLLFEQATGLQFLKLPNSFNYSLVKRRLIMLTKIKSPQWAKIRLLFVVPMLLVFLLVFACNKNKVTDLVEEAVVLKEQNTNIENQTSLVDDKIYFTVDKMPVFPGGEKELRKFIATNIKYPIKAKETGTEGKIFVQFVVNESGDVEQVKQVAVSVPVKEKNDLGEVVVMAYTEVFQKNGKAYDELIAEAVRVVRAQPKWTPGEHEGKKVKVSFTVPINFALSDK
jgi:beta-lactamase regulating signal transducer with metallopeptidase domain